MANKCLFSNPASLFPSRDEGSNRAKKKCVCEVAQAV